MIAEESSDERSQSPARQIGSLVKERRDCPNLRVTTWSAACSAHLAYHWEPADPTSERARSAVVVARAERIGPTLAGRAGLLFSHVHSVPAGIWAMTASTWQPQPLRLWLAFGLGGRLGSELTTCTPVCESVRCFGRAAWSGGWLTKSACGICERARRNQRRSEDRGASLRGQERGGGTGAPRTFPLGSRRERRATAYPSFSQIDTRHMILACERGCRGSVGGGQEVARRSSRIL